MPNKKRNPALGAGLRDIDRAGWPDRREDSEAPAVGQLVEWNDRFISVFDGQQCRGHLLPNARDIVAVGADSLVIGIYRSRDEARKAIREAALHYGEVRT